jgi:restriction endonuclease S subunit
MYRLWLGAASGEFSGSHAKTTIAHLPAVRLADLEVGLPSIETQSTIVHGLDEGAEACRVLESEALSELSAVAALPAALLNGAFNQTS